MTHLDNGLRHAFGGRAQKAARLVEAGIDKMGEAAAELRTLKFEMETEGSGADDLSELAGLVDSLLSIESNVFLKNTRHRAEQLDGFVAEWRKPR